MPEASTLQFLFQLAKGIASQFGPNCEVVVHDLDSNDPESSIVAIENGQVTGRKVGDGPSHVVLETLRGDREKLQDHLCYLTKTKDGKILKSTTIYIRNDDHIVRRRAFQFFRIQTALSVYIFIGRCCHHDRNFFHTFDR